LEDNKKVYTFALAFEKQASAEAARQRRPGEHLKNVKPTNKIWPVNPELVTLPSKTLPKAEKENIERFQ
jgi:hypothetical protein